MSTHEIRKQLRTLRRTGIVVTREHGELVFYRIEDPELLRLLRSLRNYYEGEAFASEEEIA